MGDEELHWPYGVHNTLVQLNTAFLSDFVLRSTRKAMYFMFVCMYGVVFT